MRYTERQNELLALLPSGIRKSKELTDSAKLVLGNIIFLYGTDAAKENGYVYRTNEDMSKDCGIHRNSVPTGVRLLVNKGLIDFEKGRIGKSNRYTLRLDYAQNCANGNDLEKRVEALENEVFLLKKTIEALLMHCAV